MKNTVSIFQTNDDTIHILIEAFDQDQLKFQFVESLRAS
jgi:hypothetical protein